MRKVWRAIWMWSLLCASFMMSLGLFLDPALARTPLIEFKMPDDTLLPPQPELSVEDFDSAPLVLNPMGRDPMTPTAAPAQDPTHGIAPQAELPSILPEKKTATEAAPTEVSPTELLPPKMKNAVKAKAMRKIKKPAKLSKKTSAKNRKAKVAGLRKPKKIAAEDNNAEFADDEYVDSEREPADVNGDIRIFKDTIRSIVDFNNQWEVNFTDNGRYRISGQPSEIYDYQRTGQYLEIKAHEGERRILNLQPIRVRFRPVR